MKNAVKRKSQSEVVARARLRGPLNDLFDETELSDGNTESSNMDARRREEQLKQRGRPSKKLKDSHATETSAMPSRSLKLTPTQKRLPIMKHASSESDDSDSDQSGRNKAQTESFVVKLFGRRVDMSKFSNNTPLYPICRAWFQNNPEDPNAINFRIRKPVPQIRRNFSGPELWEKVQRNEITQLNEMPRPCKTDLPHIPPPLAPEYVQSKDNIDAVLRESDKKKIPVELLLQDHQLRWHKVRQHWTEHAIRYRQERFRYSYLILQHLQKRNKEQQLLMQQQI